ncbi:hypothetical protein HPP92_016540 [Vanilla planifolia]|uniref:Uncharacterized protein n=1 Tax=Vanilla planifolia TaxID=51239 RepID=A0A835QGA2_VANPL|nr:hypothetical protein HPP92_016540 [Vanilla planifolia]
MSGMEVRARWRRLNCRSVMVDYRSGLERERWLWTLAGLLGDWTGEEASRRR